MLHHERTAWQRGKKIVAGVDEAGRGPLAGPVVAAAVILPFHIEEVFSQKEPHPHDRYFLQINDSKKLTPKKREELYSFLMADSRVIKASAVVGADVIDSVNILNATYLAMQQAIGKMELFPDHVLFDGWAMPERFFSAFGGRATQEGIVQGDAKSVSIAAASIVAKVTRDHLMLEYDRTYPEYAFASHKGYGTAEHMAKIREYGPTPIHRKSFAPVREQFLPGF